MGEGLCLLLLLLFFSAQSSLCPVHQKVGNSELFQSCVPIRSEDPLLALKWLTTPFEIPLSSHIRGNKPSSSCRVWSIQRQRFPWKCGRFDFRYEQSWRQIGCEVTVTILSLSKKCSQEVKKTLAPLGISFTTDVGEVNAHIDVLRIHDKKKLGNPFCILSNLYHKLKFFNFISLDVSMHTSALLNDGEGNVSAHSWYIWHSVELLKQHNFSVSKVFAEVATKDSSQQFTDILAMFNISPNVSRYDVLLQKETAPELISGYQLCSDGAPSRSQEYSNCFSNELDVPMRINQLPFRGDFNELLSPSSISLPTFCQIPNRNFKVHLEDMSDWVMSKLRWKCHSKITSSRCYKLGYIDPFIPCLGDVIASLAEDYAWASGWCTVSSKSAEIPILPGIEQSAVNHWKEINRKNASTGKSIKLAFMLTVYRDKAMVMRLLKRIYSKKHIYLINVDASSAELAAELRFLASKMGPNIFIASEIPVVYRASSASGILVRGMQWILKNYDSFHYLISCTGSDYPLLSLEAMENILNKRSPPFPSIMNWHHDTWQDVHDLSVFDKEVATALEIVLKERKPPLTPMESRATSQFGIPLTCYNHKSYVRLQARSKMDDTMDSQWLFGKCTRKGKEGNANSFENRHYSKLPRDGKFRVWYKSDPATTGVYDKRTVKYIVESEEGKKYYHFFKSMLLGSEEHYIISLLANWKATRLHVNSIKSMGVWNTWTRGTLNPKMKKNRTLGTKSPHTSFLSLNELPILRGLSRIGVFFARKFSSHMSEVLDAIDREILLNTSFPFGNAMATMNIKKASARKSKASLLRRKGRQRVQSFNNFGVR